MSDVLSVGYEHDAGDLVETIKQSQKYPTHFILPRQSSRLNFVSNISRVQLHLILITQQQRRYLLGLYRVLFVFGSSGQW